MTISKKHQFILYALMRHLKRLNEQFEDKPLETSVSKIDFIRLLQSLKVVEKSQRGIYHNLEMLEKKKLIRYNKKLLKITEKGLKTVKKREDELYPYIKLIVRLEKAGAMPSQTRLKI